MKKAKVKGEGEERKAKNRKTYAQTYEDYLAWRRDQGSDSLSVWFGKYVEIAKLKDLVADRYAIGDHNRELVSALAALRKDLFKSVKSFLGDVDCGVTRDEVRNREPMRGFATQLCNDTLRSTGRSATTEQLHWLKKRIEELVSCLDYLPTVQLAPRCSTPRSEVERGK